MGAEIWGRVLFSVVTELSVGEPAFDLSAFDLLAFDLLAFDLMAFDLSAFDLLVVDLLAFDQSSATSTKHVKYPTTNTFVKISPTGDVLMSQRFV